MNGIISLSEAKPNPVVSSSEVEYSLENSGNVVIELIDARGSRVQELYNGSQTSGLHRIDINASELSSGVYTVVMTVGNDVITKSINVVK